MFLRSVVLAIVIIFLSFPLPLFGSSAIASPRWPAAPSASTALIQNFPTVNQASQAGQVWRQVKRWMPDSPHSAIAPAPRPIASMSYPVKRAIPRILNSLMQTIVQCFRQFLWIATRQMQGLDYQWQTLDAIRPDSNVWSVRSEG